MEIQQSPQYAAYIKALGWNVVKIKTQFAYIKPLPFVGGLCKLQRIKTLPEISVLLTLCKHYHIRRLAVEPDCSVSQGAFTAWATRAKPYIRLNTDYFLPTKTIRIDLTASEQVLFKTFTEAKQRGVRRAIKNGVTVSVGQNIRDLIRIKNTSAGFLGSITTFGLDRLWPNFAPDHADAVLSYTKNHTLVGGILMLYHGSLAYYWVAGATHEGKRLHAPTLLVWEALKRAKQKGCTSFDFVGVWDERMPDQNTKWKGFTKFKEGFGGSPLYYPFLSG